MRFFFNEFAAGVSWNKFLLYWQILQKNIFSWYMHNIVEKKSQNTSNTPIFFEMVYMGSGNDIDFHYGNWCRYFLKWRVSKAPIWFNFPLFYNLSTELIFFSMHSFNSFFKKKTFTKVTVDRDCISYNLSIAITQ